ncbi:MAG: hypothetical protein PHN88_16170 [Ignavibacteria bacterium]|nr:hypothetical protein [Ignavibacteria bacterium]
MRTKNGSLILKKKPSIKYPGFSIVLAVWSNEYNQENLSEFVVWDCRDSDLTCEIGAYTTDLDAAIKNFNERK